MISTFSVDSEGLASLGRQTFLAGLAVLAVFFQPGQIVIESFIAFFPHAVGAVLEVRMLAFAAI